MKSFRPEFNKFSLVRRSADAFGVYGELYFRGVYLCDTLENSSMFLPEGHYLFDMSYSPKFKEYLPHLFNTGKITRSRGFRIHTGNSIKDTKGCILVGSRFNVVSLSNSRFVLSHLLRIIRENSIRSIDITDTFLNIPIDTPNHLKSLFYV